MAVHVCVDAGVEVVEGGSMEAVVGIWNQFQVDMQQNKRGKLDVTIRGPGKPEVNVNKRRNGIAVVRYFLTVSGEYYITVLMDGAPIAGSPFKPTIRGESQNIAIYLFFFC